MTNSRRLAAFCAVLLAGGAARALAAPAPPPASAARFGLIGAMAGTWWACSSKGAVASYGAYGPLQGDSLNVAQIGKSGQAVHATYKLDPVAGLLFGFSFKGEAVYGVVDATVAGATETYALHGVPVRETLRRVTDGQLSDVTEVYRDGAWATLDAQDCRQTTAAEAAKVKWAKKLRP